MFQTRLVREDDARLCFEVLAYLIRRYGKPGRPAVPSPLHKTQGLETLVHADTDSRQVFDWAQDSYATVMDALAVDPALFRLVASVDRVAPTPGLLTFDPRICDRRGGFAAQLLLDVVERRLDGFTPEFEPSDFQRATILLAAIAYHRQGFAMSAMIEAAVAALAPYGVPVRFVENTLLFSQCVVLSVLRQTPEQIVATYGTVLSKPARKKIRPACRQINGFEPEVKLLQVLGQPQAATPRGYVRPQIAQRAGAQPQRISWT